MLKCTVLTPFLENNLTSFALVKTIWLKSLRLFVTLGEEIFHIRNYYVIIVIQTEYVEKNRPHSLFNY